MNILKTVKNNPIKTIALVAGTVGVSVIGYRIFVKASTPSIEIREEDKTECKEGTFLPVETNTDEEMRMAKGPLRHRPKKYTEEDAIAIIKLNEAGVSKTDIARKFNLSRGTIYNIINEYEHLRTSTCKGR